MVLPRLGRQIGKLIIKREPDETPAERAPDGVYGADL